MEAMGETKQRTQKSKTERHPVVQEPNDMGSELTCQLVSTGRPDIRIRKAVRLGRGAARSW